MRTSIATFALLLFAGAAYAQVHVDGYYRKDGRYVQPYVRSAPDRNPYNNYSYPGNTNPYTGKQATGNPNAYLNNYGSRGSLGNTNWS